MNRLRAGRSLLGLCVLLLVGCGAGDSSSEWKRLEAPRPAASFTLPRLNGGSASLSDFKGQVVLMDFWATWCGPCRMSLPSLESIYRQYKDRGVMVLLVSEGESEARVKQWAKQRFTAPILLDEAVRVGKSYGVSGVPHLVVIDRVGNIIYVHEGYGGGLERHLRQVLDSLLQPAGSSST